MNGYPLVIEMELPPGLVRARAVFARVGCASCGVRLPFPASIAVDSKRDATAARFRIAELLDTWRQSGSGCGWCERRERDLRLERS